MSNKIEIENNELYIRDASAEIHEIKDLAKNNVDCLRVYQSHPNGFTIQVRTYQPIVPTYVNPEAKPRNMIGSVSLSFEEVEALYNFIKQKKEGKL